MGREYSRRVGIRVSIAIILAVFLLPFGDSAAADKKAGSSKKEKKEICITFNELPVAKGFGDADMQAINFLILDKLKAHNVKAAGFVVGESIDDAFDILGQWLNDGHTLGSMTYSNPDLHDLGIEQFISDIKLGAEAVEPMLTGFGQKKRYFRFPYLHYGNTVKEKTEIQKYLDHMKYVVAHATIVPEDYLYNLSLEKLGKIPDSAAYVNLLNEYVNHVLDEVDREEGLAREITGHSVRQIMLLRANRLNAVFLDEILTQLENMGYTFVTLDYALKDPVYTETEAYFGPKGVGYLDMIHLSNADLLPAE